MKYSIKERNTNSKIHIYLCLTHTFDTIIIPFFDFICGLQSKYSYSVVRNNMLPVDRNRTHLVKEVAMKDPTMTHCLFIDTDIIPKDPNFLDIMVSYDLPIVGLLCTKKVPPFEPIMIKNNAKKEEMLNGFWVTYPKGLVKVDATGTGCLLVKREVFENMSPPYFKFIGNFTKDLHMSEDVYFLNKARQSNYDIYVDTEHTCDHYGMYGFGVANFEKNRGETK